MLLAENKYGRYAVPESSAHRPAAQAVLRGGIWEPDTIELIREKCGIGDVVHAGAYFGDFLPALSKALASGSTLWAWEPSPTNYRHALETIRINGLENVVLRREALGSEPARACIATTDRSGNDVGGLSRIVESPAEFANVDVVCVDNFVPHQRRVTVLQLDVEGYEQPALMGAMRTIGCYLPLLILEDWDGRLVDGEWFRETILELGYIRKQNVHENAVFEVER